MKKVVLLIVVVFTLYNAGFCSENDKPDYLILSQEKLDQYKKFLDRKNNANPVDYAAGKFADHDVVIIGETHRRKEDAEFICSVIIEAYKKYNVRNIAWEFGYFRVQKQTDLLVTGEQFDEKLMMDLAAQNSVIWLYNEYLEIYKTIWQLNREIKNPEKKIRLINCGNTLNTFSLHCSQEQIMKDEEYKDRRMAESVLDVVEKKGEKVLLYCGRHHAFTKYKQPADLNDHTKTRERCGNFVYDKIGKRVFLISLYSPSHKKSCYFDNIWENGYLFPFNAVPEQLIRMYGKPICIDTDHKEFSEIFETNSYYSTRLAKLGLNDFCDGYIIHKSLKDYNRVSSVSMDKIRLLELSYYDRLFPPSFNEDKWSYELLEVINRKDGVSPARAYTKIHKVDSLK